jgi:hypothetical protein
VISEGSSVLASLLPVPSGLLCPPSRHPNPYQQSNFIRVNASTRTRPELTTTLPPRISLHLDSSRFTISLDIPDRTLSTSVAVGQTTHWSSVNAKPNTLCPVALYQQSVCPRQSLTSSLRWGDVSDSSEPGSSHPVAPHLDDAPIQSLNNPPRCASPWGTATPRSRAPAIPYLVALALLKGHPTTMAPVPRARPIGRPMPGIA